MQTSDLWCAWQHFERVRQGLTWHVVIGQFIAKLDPALVKLVLHVMNNEIDGNFVFPTSGHNDIRMNLYKNKLVGQSLYILLLSELTIEGAM